MELMRTAPPGMFRHSLKHGEYDRTTTQGRRKLQNRQNRTSGKEVWGTMYIELYTDGSHDAQTTNHLKPFKRDFVMRNLDHINDLYLQGKLPANFPGLQLDDMMHGLNSTKMQSWQSYSTGPPASTQMQGIHPHSFPSNPKKRRADTQHARENTETQNPLHTFSQDTSPVQMVSQSMSNTTMSSGETSLPRTGHAKGVQRAIRMDDTNEWVLWDGSCFKAIQQSACRFIAKEWIKLIHPKKQSTHPYNGNFPRNLRASPERTRPPYWPPGVRHKEPDHIDKDDRTTLLVHLLMHTPHQEMLPDGRSGKEIRAIDFLEVLTKKKEELQGKWPIIEQLIAAQSEREKYMENEIDGDALVYVDDYCDNLRSGANGKKVRIRSRAKPKARPQDTGFGPGLDESRVASPLEDSYAQTEFADSDDDDGVDDYDDTSLQSTSFTSEDSRTTVQSSVPRLAMKPDVQPMDHNQRHLHTGEQRELHADIAPPCQEMHAVYNAPHPPPTSMHSSWEMIPPILQSAEAFPPEMLMLGHPSLNMGNPPHFDPAVYAASRPANMNGTAPMLSYDGHALYDYEYQQALDRDTMIRRMSEMGHSIPNPSYPADEDYMRMYAPPRHPPQH